MPGLNMMKPFDPVVVKTETTQSNVEKYQVIINDTPVGPPVSYEDPPDLEQWIAEAWPDIVRKVRNGD